MTILVIGLGSMGKRRIRLIQKYDVNFQIVGIDASEMRRVECEKTYGITTFSSVVEAFEQYKMECAFICTPPLTHNELTSMCLNHGLHVFTELNLTYDGYEQNIELSRLKSRRLFLSSTFIYRDEIMEIKRRVQDTEGAVNYNYHVGQYLPDWHPWESYKDYFIGDKRTNGCREIFAIELPWIVDTFGEITKVSVVKSKMSTLEIDYNDNYLLIVEHSTGHKGTLSVNVVSRKAVRNLEVYGESLYLQWDGSPKGLKFYDFIEKNERFIELYQEIDRLEGYNQFVIENAYYNEIVSFFDSIENMENMNLPYSFEKDKDILNLIDKIEA